MYFTINNYQTTIETINYQLRTFYHANLSHMFGNLFSFIMVSNLENVLGSQQYFLCIVFISVLSSLMLQLYHNTFESRKVYTIGFSAVVYGLFVVYIYALSTNKGVSAVNLIIGLLPQIFMLGVSWEGHICGIFSGLIYVTLFPIKKDKLIH
jgi:membrane associated rhomboid family serine protease